MAQSQNVIREIIVGNAVATETNMADYVADASPLEIAVVAADGGEPGVGKDFFVVTKAAGGQLIKSDLVKTKTITRAEGVDYEAPVQREVHVDFDVPTDAGDKTDFQVQIRVYNAGSLSVENTEIIVGHHTFTQTGALTSEDVVDAIIANLNANMSRKAGATATTNPYFTFTKDGVGNDATLVIASVEQVAQRGTAFGRPLEFDVIAFSDDDDVTSNATVEVIEPGNPGKGTGTQVANLEWFYRGERGDAHRGIGYPYTWSTVTKTLTDPSANYNAIEINHSNGNDNGINKIIIPKELTIAVAGDAALRNTLLATIESFIEEPAAP